MSREKFGFFQKTSSEPTSDQEIQAMAWDSMRNGVKSQLEFALKSLNSNDIRDQQKSHYILATYYRHGWEVPRDNIKSLDNYEKAAKKGHLGACYELARLYLEGDTLMDINKDLDLASYYAVCGITSTTEDNVADKEQLKSMIEVIEFLKRFNCKKNNPESNFFSNAYKNTYHEELPTSGFPREAFQDQDFLNNLSQSIKIM